MSVRSGLRARVKNMLELFYRENMREAQRSMQLSKAVRPFRHREKQKLPQLTTISLAYTASRKSLRVVASHSIFMWASLTMSFSSMMVTREEVERSFHHDSDSYNIR